MQCESTPSINNCSNRQDLKQQQLGVDLARHCNRKATNDENKPLQTHKKMMDEVIQIPWLNRFLETTYANCLMKTPTKIAVMLLYAAVLGGSFYGIATLKTGLDLADVAPRDSYFHDFMTKYKRDFLGSSKSAIQVAVDEALDYTDQRVRANYNKLIAKFQNNSYISNSKDSVNSWLDHFLKALRSKSIEVNSLTMSEFIGILQNDFFVAENYQYYRSDVVFSSNNTTIQASRFFVQTRELGSKSEWTSMMLDARKIAADYIWDVKVYNPYFLELDQYLVILENTLQNLAISVGAIAIVSLVLIPSITAVVWVTLATMSIFCMVIGYMSLWDVKLDSISMIGLVMCIGFSVDFTAHISYHLVTSSSDDRGKSARDALGTAGTPILQGALSTILAVTVFSTSTRYMFTTFFKVLFLMMTFGVFHAMAVLPVVLSIFNRNAADTLAL